MKKHLSSRVLSLLLVVALFVGLVVPVNAATPDSDKQSLEFEKTDETVSSKLSESVVDKESSESDEQYAPDDTVRVSIVLSDDSTIERFGATDIASNTSAMAYRRRLKNTQASMTDKIGAATGSKLDVAWNLTLAANLISANVRYDEIEKIEKIPGVKSVVIETRYEPMVVDKSETNDPNMATSSAQIGSSTAWAAGYTGAGSKVAVIDTGIDYEHQSFSAEGYNYSMQLNAEKAGISLDAYKAKVGVLTKAGLTNEILAQLNVQVTADKVYLNDKIPFAYNYIDKSYTVDHLHDSQGEHGSHVEGIAAANAYIPNGDGTFSSALEKVQVQGVAPDAQIVTMKVFGAGGGAYDSDYMAAIEDAIVLGCDSVNLSLGSGNPGFSRSDEYQSVMDSLAENGVVVCMSAGNSYNWPNTSASGIGYLYDNEISFQVDGSPGSFTNSLAVASVNNDGFTGSFFTVGEQNVFYTETSYTNAALTTLAGEHDYVILPTGVAGNAADFEGIDVSGKIVFVQRGGISFYQKGENAVNAGAIATIVYNNAAGTINMDLSSYTKTAPCVSITQADGLAIWAASEQSEDGKYAIGKMTVKQGIGSVVYNSETYTMSDFSSWGVPGSLELKPEITAPGGSIYSVWGANISSDGAQSGHDQYENMSGTSMASPQVAGMAAVLGQYIRDNNLEDATGKTARQLINSLLMSTAKPITNAESGTTYSVLNQGAGLANVGDAINAASYIMMKDNLSGTAADGKVKAEFGDDPEKKGVYTAKFSINNLNGEAQEYTFSTEVFTQDMFEYEGVNYLDTWTKPIAADVTYEVDGQTFVPTSKVECDVDHDGDTDSDDAQCILEHVAGNHADGDNCDLTVADLDGDGSVTTYDAYLLLKGLTVSAIEVPVNSAVNVKVTIKLTDAAKAYLDENYPVGAYVEGYIYVNTANTADGEILPMHSIPMLGFYGNWSDGSALDTSTYVEKLYGDERIPHTGVMQTNYQTVKYPGDKSDYIYTVNPYVIEGDTTADIPYDRAAISTKSSIAQFKMTVERNAAAAVYFVQDGDGKVVYTGGVTEQFLGAYYYVNGGAWRNTTAKLTANQKVSSLGFKEGETFTAGVALIPEYYEKDGAMTKEQVTALIESGKLGDGCVFAYTYTVDDTAPEIVDVEKSLQTGAVTVLAKDNQYVAYIGIYKGNGAKLIAGGVPQQDEAGELCGVTVPLDDSVGEYITIVVADYAGHEVTYKAYYGGTPEDYTGRMFGYTSSNSRGNGQRWIEIDPETISSTGSMADYAEVDYEVYAAEYAGKYVFFATADGIYAASLDELGSPQKLTALEGFDVNEMVADMAFDTQNKTMYLLTNHIADINRGALANNREVVNALYSLDLVTGALTKVADITTDSAATWGVLRAMAIDSNGNFYAINNSFDFMFKIYKWTLSDVENGALKLEGEKLEAPDITVYSYASMTYDQNSGKLYLTGSYGNKSGTSSDNVLWVVDPATNTAKRANSSDSCFKEHVVGLFVVPANTITLPKDAAITKVEMNPSEITLYTGTTYSLEASVYPWLAANKSVTWSTSDASTVSVEDGEIKTLKVGTATITAASVADPTKTAECVVTVKALPEIKASALIYDTDNKAYWADFSTSDTTKWTKASEDAAGSYVAGTLHEGEILVHNGTGDAMFGIDPDTFEVTSYGTIASSWQWSDAAESPVVDGCFGRMIALCNEGTFVELLNPAEGTLSYFDLSTSGFADDPLATIAYIGSGTYLDEYLDYSSFEFVTVECPANFYYVMTESGALYKFTAYNNDDDGGENLTIEFVGYSGLDLSGVSAVTGGQYASMIYDQKTGFILLSHYADGETAKLYAIDPKTMIPAEVGNFGEKVWPVVSLYQYQRATDLTLRVSPTSATIYVGDSMTVSTKVLLGSTDELTWTTDNAEVATVKDGVITGVKEGTATITVTTVDTNKAGQHVSQEISVNVLPVVPVDATVKAQITDGEGTAWVDIDLSDMSTKKLGDARTTLYGGGYAAGALWGTDVKDETGHIYKIDAKTFAETQGSGCSTYYAMRDATDNPAISFTLTEGETVHEATAFGDPIYLPNVDALYQLSDYVEGDLSGWDLSGAGCTDMAAIAYIGDVKLSVINASRKNPITKADENTDCHIFFVLSTDGTIYQFITVPTYDTTKEEVGATLLLGEVGNAGKTFSDVSALSAEYVDFADDNYGLLVADATDASIYYVNLAGSEIVTNKVGKLNGVSNISSLYSAAKKGDASDALLAKMGMKVSAPAKAAAVNAAPEKKDDAYFSGTAQSASLRANVGSAQDTAIEYSTSVSVELRDKAVNASTGSLNAAKANATTDKSTDGTYNVVVKITDTEAVTNGKYVVSYDPAKLTYVGSNGRTYSAIHVDEAKGEIVLAYANATEAAAGTVLGTIKFSAEKNVQTNVSVTTEERNSNTDVKEAPAVVNIDTTEKNDTPIIVVPTKPGSGSNDKKFPFTDVGKYDDCYDAVKYLYDHDIMNGTSDTLFSPNAELTRGMVVTILYRMEGEPFTTGAKTFSDVQAGRYYSKAVEWAAENDIVNGFKDGTFKPNQAVTREQLAAIISRYASYNGIVIYEPTDALASTDVVSNWAKKDVAWAAAEGILTPAQTANATKNATRAEVAMAIYTYLTKTAK